MSVNHKMLIIEDKLKEIFDQLPLMQNSAGVEFKLVFRYGDNLELLAFLKNAKGNTSRPYPLIWLLYPYEEIQDRTTVDVTDMVLIIATETNAESNYQQRMEENFKKVLIPLYENIKLAFLRANTIYTSDVYNVTKYPNYGRPEENKAEAIDLWDAMRIEFNCSINNSCINTIKF